jgi:uncharacterized protein (DUF4415 family)
MPTEKKPKNTSQTFSREQVAQAIEGAAPAATPTGIHWKAGVVTSGGGVRETIAQLRRTRGRNKSPTKEQVAIRLDPEVLAAFRASGRGWQTRMNSALKEWLKEGSLPKARARAKAGS